jgi:hypothetical protein
VIFLIHLLEHLGVPSGAAIAVVIAGRKALKAGAAKVGGSRDRDRDRRSARGYRRAQERAADPGRRRAGRIALVSTREAAREAT